MIPSAPIPQDFPYITVLRLRRTPAAVDPYSGEETLGSWADAAELDVEGCLLAPGTSDDFPDVDIEQVSALATLYTPLGVDIKTEDRVRAGGALWDVIGRRADWEPYGSVVTLRFVREES